MVLRVCVIFVLFTVLLTSCSSTPKYVDPAARAMAYDVDTKKEFEYYWDQSSSSVTYFRGVRPKGEEIIEVDSRAAVLLTNQRALVFDKANKKVDILDIKQDKAITSVKDVNAFMIEHIGGRRIGFSSNVPVNNLKETLAPEITLYPYFKNAPLTLKMGGPSSKHGKYTGTRRGNNTDYSEFFFSCGTFYCVNRFDGEKTVGMVLDYDLNVVNDNLGVFSYFGVYPSQQLNQPASMRELQRQVLTDAGPLTSNPLAKHAYRPLNKEGQLMPLPHGVSSVAPIVYEFRGETIGWVLLLDQANPPAGKIFVGLLDEMPKDISALPTAYEYQIVTGSNSPDDYHNVIIRTSKDQWQLVAGVSRELQAQVGKIYQGTAAQIRQEVTDQWWKSYYAANPQLKASYDRSKAEKEKAQQLEYESQSAKENYLKVSYPKMVADGSICNHFEVAQHHGIAGLNEYMRKCKIKNQAEYDAIKNSSADKKLLQSSSQAFRDNQSYEINATARNKMREDSIRRQRYDPTDTTQGASAPNKPTTSPSQGLSQQQRYEYNKKLDKDLKRAVGK